MTYAISKTLQSGIWPNNKPPRAWAAEIMRETDIDRRRQLIDQVPDAFRDWVRDLVIAGWNKRGRHV